MKTFTVPVVLTISGWITIEAESRDAAIVEAFRLDDEGIDEVDIQDAAISSEVIAEEIQEEKR